MESFGQKYSIKKIKKLSKKVLTKGKDGDIITKLSAEAGSDLDLEN